MPLQNFKEILTNLLKTDARLIDEQGELLINIVHEFANNLDSQLIELLIDEAQTREKFFLQIKDVFVFKQSDFKFFLDENKIDNSYTQYENKIGLSFGSRLLRETSDVVLNFPYKDCVLEGGQSTEEGTDIYFEYDIQAGDYVEKKAKRKEVFFNQILARDEIDRLFEPKAFTKIKCYTREGDEQIESFNRDENDRITDNLIIKGNNLLALHSLKHEFRGTVKLIYIDPPYNTGNDSFAYNDNFNHSSWLTFMKNRLEVARELLREDGFIFISCDDSEQAYLKIICDEVFKKDNFLANFIWRRRKTQANLAKYIAPVHDFIICISKNKSETKINKIPYSDEFIKKTFSNPDKDSRGVYQTGPLARPANSSNKEYTLKMPNGRAITAKWSCSQATFDRYVAENRLVIPKDGQGMPRIKIFLYELEGQIPNTWLDNIATNDEASREIESFFGSNAIFSFSKPANLIKHLLLIGCQKDDIILDFFAGSGTTAHAVLQLNKEDGGNRQFILVEQMDYAESITAARVKKVMEKEGIESSFIYLELAKNNQNAIEKIEKVESYEALMAFFKEMYEKYFLGYNVRIKEFREKISQEGAFKNLPLEQQKQIFAKMLDLNQLYVNVSDMHDARYDLSKEDIALTKDFYQLD
ncbi:DNA methyltransferase [Emticicia sp.]|uniref:DNA methyltransferase n=1 Tax=Emticicia sp. TaxID=1930953 RepID=UPI0037517175